MTKTRFLRLDPASQDAPRQSGLTPIAILIQRMVAASLVLPDLLTAKSGESRWVEVKFKDSATYTTRTKRLETGINGRLWVHYQKVQSESGIPVYLVFAHKKEDEVRCAPLQSLIGTERVYTGIKMGRHGMVFFDYSKLSFLCKLSEIAPELFTESVA